jgi:hypothetical protein
MRGDIPESSRGTSYKETDRYQGNSQNDQPVFRVN